MQYLLTEQEYNDLITRGKKAEEKQKEILQDLCTKVADHMPVLWGWSKDEKPKVWQCIHSVEGEWYCDSCPVQKVCPEQYKHWSK